MSFFEDDRAKLANLAETALHHGWLLNAILQKLEKVENMVDNLDTFVADMTAKMTAEEAGIASLRPFIQGLFDKIAQIPGLTDAQKAALDAMEAKVDTDAAAIAAAMGPPA